MTGTPTPVQMQYACDCLLAGQLAAFPTETVYGLGADAENPEAVARIYAAKGRPSDHPVIVHIAPDARIEHWAAHVPDMALQLMNAFWPGPLTLIFKRRPFVADAASGGQDSIGIRCPSHPVAQQLLRAFAAGKAGGQGGVAAPSANKFGHVSPTRADHVRMEFAAEVAAGMPVLDGGASAVGIESTILDLSRLEQGVGPVLLRPGHITAAQLAAVIGRQPASPDLAAPRASGTLRAHYAPHTPLARVTREHLLKIVGEGARGQGERVVAVAWSPLPAALPTGLDWRVVPADPDRYAHALYALLRELDSQGYARILMEMPPAGPEWDGINDRLTRAAAAFSPDNAT
jgi:L-threonylcarbamoyladenylate synthase